MKTDHDVYHMLAIPQSKDDFSILLSTQTSADFEYVDVWSSRYTWGDHDPPTAGDFVVIPSTMTILLDTVTPVLKMLLIQGTLYESGKRF